MTLNGLITIAALLFVGMCFALAAGYVLIGICIIFAMGVFFVVGSYWLTDDNS